MLTENKRVIGIVIGVAIILSIPLIVMQFTAEVDWSLLDFVVMGTFLLGTGLVCEMVMRKVKNLNYRIALIGVILFSLFLIWAELAVGIFGSPLAGS